MKPLYISSPTLDARYSGYWNPLYTSLISGLSSIVNEFTIPASAYAQSYEHAWIIMNSYKFEVWIIPVNTPKQYLKKKIIK